MKKIITFVAAIMLLSQSANALIVSVNGRGDIPAEGMTITVSQAEEDPLTGQMRMEIKGTILANGSLDVLITRQEEGIEDEFCCGQCVPGNGEKSQELEFAPNGISEWYSHYTPAANSDVTIEYLFREGEESRKLTVRYLYTAEGVENVPAPAGKKGVYSLNGALLQAEGETNSLPDGIYIQNGKTIYKHTH